MNDRLMHFREIIERETRRSYSSFEYGCRNLLAGIDLADKHIIDVGSGSGNLLLYLALVGRAGEVVGVDPSEGEGGRQDAYTLFQKKAALLGLDNVSMIKADFMTCELEQQFDVLTSVASVNHIFPSKEDTTISRQAWAGYVGVIGRFFDTLNPGGIAVITEVSRRNFWRWTRFFGWPDPFHRGKITWERHQMPEQWVAMMHEVGFNTIRVRYPVSWRLRSAAPFLGNALGSYLTNGRFVITGCRPLVPTEVESSWVDQGQENRRELS